MSFKHRAARVAVSAATMAALLGGGMGAAVAADQSFSAIGKGATDNSADGSYDVLTDNFRVGYSSFLNQTYRSAMEFNLASLPAGAVINSATLRLRAATSAGTTLYGYSGDGFITLADVAIPSAPELKSFVPVAGNYESHDVTSFVQNTYNASNLWMGFLLSGLSNSLGMFDGPINANPPKLDITYTVTTAVPEPEAYALMLAGLGLVGAVVRRRKGA